MLKRISLLFFLIYLPSCNYFFSSAGENPQVLTREDAANRSEQVVNIRYRISLDISREDNFRGDTEIEFDLVKLDSPVRIDLAYGKIESIHINSQPWEDWEYEEGFFIVSTNLLEPGKNKIRVVYTHPYSRSGNGLHRFTDPEDGETYLYTQFETNHAKSMFPCFDQPDMKASYRLDAIHPSHWTLISSDYPEKSVIGKDKNTKHTFFPETKVFSTYIFSLHAGPYREWKDNYQEIPLKLYARKSMAKYVNTKLWFDVTKQGFEYFESYFGIPYPFSKYDQVVVPEFNFGAMENVGAVTFSERFLSRGKVTRSMKEKLASVILHEMAHMWFGNLVTMKWWDGLWLNESFATYMAAKAQYEATEFTEAWETFFSGMKSWAYKADKSITTHPIQGEVADTEEAFTNFDGITYGKGASVLKQLEFFIGSESFQKGVNQYLKRFSYSNATLRDFLSSLEKSSGRDLGQWSYEWLETTGYNRILATHSCTPDGKLQSIRINQDHVTNTNIPRSHKTNVAVFKISESSDKKVELLDTRIVEYGEGITTIPWNKKVDCPDFVFPNYKDYDYVRVDYPEDLLDEKDMSTLHSILPSTDTLTSLMLWRDLFEEVRDGDLSIQRYAKLNQEILPNDPRDIVLESNLGYLTGSHFPSYHAFLYLFPSQDRTEKINELEETSWKYFLEAKPNTDRKKTWFRSYIRVGQSSAFQKKVVDILTGKSPLPGLNLDQDIRWSLLKKYCSLQKEKSAIQDLLESEKKRDKSRLGINSALACEASLADPVRKGKWMTRLTQPSDEYSASTLRTVMHSIFPIHQMNQQIPFVEYYYNNIKENKIQGDENYQEYYSGILAPRFCTQENRVIMRKFIYHNRRIPVNISKNLKEILEAEEECLRIRETSDI